MENNNFEKILYFVIAEFKGYEKSTCVDIAFTLKPYANSLFKMINENKEIAKETILHDFRGLKQVDADFLPRLAKD